MSDIRVCRNDGEPLVWTFEFTGAEWFCVVCEGHEDLFGARAPLTPERQRRLDDLTEQYERARAERRGEPHRPRPKVGDKGTTTPVCVGCGKAPEPGTALDSSGKPTGWFSRRTESGREFACARSCVPVGERVLPW